MYMNPQWTERSLMEEIQALGARIEELRDARDRKSKHTVSFLKQMARAKREQLATLPARLPELLPQGLPEWQAVGAATLLCNSEPMALQEPKKTKSAD